MKGAGIESKELFLAVEGCGSGPDGKSPAHGRLVATAVRRGRALCCGADGALYISNGYNILRSDDEGAAWRLDCYIPTDFLEGILSGSRLLARLSRRYIAALNILSDGTRVAIARDGVYRARQGETRMERVWKVGRGSRPLNIAVDCADRILFGEYGELPEGVRLYVSDDRGSTFEIAYEFPKGNIRHVHNILCDDHGYWILAGDFGQEPGIAALTQDLKNLDWVSRGDQKVRAVSAIVEPDCLVYGTDSDRERNYIVRFEKQTGRLDILREVEGSSLFATTFGPIQCISTCVEPNPECPSALASLYVRRGRADWWPIASYRKDRFHPIVFQFGTIVLPLSKGRLERPMFSGQGLRGLDGRVIVGKLDTSGW